MISLGSIWRPASIHSARPECPNSDSAHLPSIRASEPSATRGIPITPPAPRRRALVRLLRRGCAHCARNDGGGSIRIPAGCNGLVGLKPTRGRLPQDKLIRRMPVRIISDGVVTRSVRDTAAFYREAERIWRNRSLQPIGAVTGPGRDRLRIGVVTGSVLRESSPVVRDVTLKTASLLEELGHRVEVLDNPVPSNFVDDFLLYWASLALTLVQTGGGFWTIVRSWAPGQFDSGFGQACDAEPASIALVGHASEVDRSGDRATLRKL